MRSVAVALILGVNLLGCAAGTGGSNEPAVAACGGAVADWPVGSVRGTVNAEDGKPVSGARVMVEGTGCAAISADDGSYSIPRVPVGTHTVVVQIIGFDTLRRADVKIEPGVTTDVDVVLGGKGFLIRKR